MKQPKNYYFKRIILFLNMLVITCSVILTRSFINVYADDYTYIPIGDIEQYNAYRFFSLYGYSLDYTNTISYNESLTGTYTYEGSASGTLGGIINGSFSASIASTYSSTSSDGTGSDSNITGTINLENMTMTIEADSAGSYPTGTMGCTFSNPNTSVGAYTSMTCTTTGGNVFTIPDLEVTVENNGNVSGFILENLYLHFHEVGSESGGFSANVSLNESESISGSGTISLDGSSSTTGHKIYDLPSLTLTNYVDYRSNLTSLSNNNFVIAFLTPNTSTNKNISIIDNNGTNKGNFTVYNHRLGGYSLIIYEMPNINTTYYRKVSIPSDFYTNIVPLYVGYKTAMSDDLYRYLYRSDRTDELLNNGTEASQTAGNNLNSETSSFSDASDDLHSFETDMKNNMNDALDNIDSDSIYNTLWDPNKTGPLQSMNWVKTQFNRLIGFNAIKISLVYSLTLGLALTIIGKLRNK